jgi:cytochrome c oxidase subunit 2
MTRLVRWRLGAAALLCSTLFVRAASGRQDAASNDADATKKAALMNLGAAVFGANNCLDCHGDGGAGPSFTNNSALANRDAVVRQILKGTDNMSEFASTLTDAQIAAVATFIRNSFDNAYGVVLEPDVKRLRDEVVKKK